MLSQNFCRSIFGIQFFIGHTTGVLLVNKGGAWWPIGMSSDSGSEGPLFYHKDTEPNSHSLVNNTQQLTHTTEEAIHNVGTVAVGT